MRTLRELEGETDLLNPSLDAPDELSNQPINDPDD